MGADKDRLYVAIYARAGSPTMPGKEDTYHWALLVGPKSETLFKIGICYHAKETLNTKGQPEWDFQETPYPPGAAPTLLARVMVAKVKSVPRLSEVLRKVPVRPEEKGWNCVSWVKEALETVRDDGKVLGTNAIDWRWVCREVMGYVQKKKEQHRFDGKAEGFDPGKVPTYDLVRQDEIIP